MNKWIALFALLTIINMPGCSMFDTKDEPTIFVTPTLATAPAITPTPITNTVPVIVQPTVSETKDLTPAVPRVTQAVIIGVVRELVKSGCMIKQVANTDGVHYSQLIVTCGDPEQAPAIAIP